MESQSRGQRGLARGGFTLVELLVVIGIIALLISILLPALSRAQQQSRLVKCMANLRTICQGLVNYSTDNNGYVIPSFNMPAAERLTPSGPSQAMEGWCSILDRDGYTRTGTHDDDTASVFYCPDTYDIYGMENGQTTTVPGLARGYIEWPMYFTQTTGDNSPQVKTTIPDQNYNKIIRCSYWINSYNPVGPANPSPSKSIANQDLYYTVSVGWGPDAIGAFTQLHRTARFKHSSRLVTVADGVYMGRQSSDGLDTNLQPNSNDRIGFRHRGPMGANTMANVGFADGHVEAIDGWNFPQSSGASQRANNKVINLTGPTVYADPEAAFP